MKFPGNVTSLFLPARSPPPSPHIIRDEKIRFYFSFAIWTFAIWVHTHNRFSYSFNTHTHTLKLLSVCVCVCLLMQNPYLHTHTHARTKDSMNILLRSMRKRFTVKNVAHGYEVFWPSATLKKKILFLFLGNLHKNTHTEWYERTKTPLSFSLSLSLP